MSSFYRYRCSIPPTDGMKNRRHVFNHVVNLARAPISHHRYLVRLRSRNRPSKTSKRLADDRHELRIVTKQSRAKPIHTGGVASREQQTHRKRKRRKWSIALARYDSIR